MMKKIFAGAILFSSFAFSQMGINTQQPQATFDVFGFPTDATKKDGIIAPRLTGNQLRAKNTVYTAAQDGSIVYITEADSLPSGKTANVTAIGYYYYDKTLNNNAGQWVKIANGGTVPAVFDITNDEWVNASGKIHLGKLSNGTTNRLISQDVTILDNGRVGIGTDAPRAIFSIVQPDNTNVGISLDNIRANTGHRDLTTISGRFKYTDGTQGAWEMSAANNNTAIADGFRIQLRETEGNNNSWRVGLLMKRDGALSLAGNMDGANPAIYITEKNTQNVGIGTSSPTHKFHVNGTFRLQGNGAADGRVLTSDADGGATWKNLPANTNIYTNNGTITGTRLVNQDGYSLVFQNATNINAFSVRTSELRNSAILSVDGLNSRVGIGTPDPSTKLHINSGSEPGFRLVDGTQASGRVLTSNGAGVATWQNLPNFDATDDAFVNDPANNIVKLGTRSNGTTARAAGTDFVITDNGRVGIGTALPDNNLHVIGGVTVGDKNAIQTRLTDSRLQFHNAAGSQIANVSVAEVDGNTVMNINSMSSTTVHTRMNLNAGNVSIGGLPDTIPTEKLMVEGAVKIASGGYTGITEGSTTPVPTGGRGTIVYSNGSFWGYTASGWKKLHS